MAATNLCSFAPARPTRLASTRPLCVFLLVRSLEVGGAERQLTALACALHARGHRVHVGVFYLRGALIKELERAGVPIVDLAKRGRWDFAGFLLRLKRALADIRPDVVYSYLGGANIFAAAARLAGADFKLAWSVRASDMDLTRYDWTHRLASRVERLLSGLPDIIIANSVAGRDYAIRNGFPGARIELASNGIDTDRFSADPALRATQRQAWQLAPQQIAVGILARLDPMKDHATFLRAAKMMAEVSPNLHFLCVGEGPEREKLVALAEKLGIAHRVSFTGEADSASALNAFDIACSTSITEGFPNAIAEAMACGKPCVVTDVGDSALIVGDHGLIVSPRDPDALARAVLRQVESLPASGHSAARQRIVDHFSLDASIERTLLLLRQIQDRQSAQIA